MFERVFMDFIAFIQDLDGVNVFVLVSILTKMKQLL